jgi:hypothetical protein
MRKDQSKIVKIGRGGVQSVREDAKRRVNSMKEKTLCGTFLGEISCSVVEKFPSVVACSARQLPGAQARTSTVSRCQRVEKRYSLDRLEKINILWRSLKNLGPGTPCDSVPTGLLRSPPFDERGISPRNSSICIPSTSRKKRV